MGIADVELIKRAWDLRKAGKLSEAIATMKLAIERRPDPSWSDAVELRRELLTVGR